MRRVAALAFVAASLAWGCGSRAVAIESSSFSLEPASGTPAFTVAVAAGATATVTAALTNKSGARLQLGLESHRAFVDGSGRPQLGGSDPAADWVRPAVPTVTLAVGERRLVDVEIRVPDSAPGGRATAALVATPLQPPADTAVVERLAVMVYVDVRAGDRRTPLAPALVAAGALLAVAVWVTRRAQRRVEDAGG